MVNDLVIYDTIKQEWRISPIKEQNQNQIEHKLNLNWKNFRCQIFENFGTSSIVVYNGDKTMILGDSQISKRKGESIDCNFFKIF
jgi:hypothetical protein